MNSLNIISARVSPTSSPAPTRTNSLSALGLATAVSQDEEDNEGQKTENNNALGFNHTNTNEKDSGRLTAEPEEEDLAAQREHRSSNDERHDDDNEDAVVFDEHTSLISKTKSKAKAYKAVPEVAAPWLLWPKRIASAFIDSLRWLLSTLAAPGIYMIAFLYDADGKFAPFRQLKRLFGMYGGDARKMAVEYHEAAAKAALAEKDRLASMDGTSDRKHNTRRRARLGSNSSYSSSGLSSESESDLGRRKRAGLGQEQDNTLRPSAAASGSGRHLRSKSLQETEEIAPARRSIRIKLHSEDSLRQRKHRKVQSAGGARGEGGSGTGSGGPSTPGGGGSDISAQLKSPTSPAGALTRYPKTPAPPRPLIPRRQPSYIVNPDPTAIKHQKTLILDLDETLIHSMSKGGRGMSSGHMVEVRLATTYVGVGGQASIGPQHPILYYVHKRPHCDEFLRRVSKWFNLVVFTASVQEYADPVIDWLEVDRKYFSARYYRQHCTFRHGAFIKDLSSVEPDLSKVMILDNSPLSYMFHQDNAIPIQGWISDPTDNDLMYLIPFLEGLQYVSDVRALLALRGGEDGQHMA